MRYLITAACVAFAGPLFADDFKVPAGCVSFSDAGAAHMLWENPVVQEHFEGAVDISPDHQHSIVGDSCYLVQYWKDYPGQGADSDFFTFVAESAMYAIWTESGVLDQESGVSRFGLYAALHEISHGRSVP
jgi:hypothetical protein